MCSVWLVRAGCKCQSPTKLAGHLDAMGATVALRGLEAQWLGVPGNRIYRADGMTSLLYNAGGRLMGMLYLEPLSPPSKADPGDVRRPTANSGAA